MIIIIYSECPIFTNPVDWLKSLKCRKNLSFKVEHFKIFLGGLCTHPRSGGGEAVTTGGKNRGWEKWKKEKMVSILNF